MIYLDIATVTGTTAWEKLTLIKKELSTDIPSLTSVIIKVIKGVGKFIRVSVTKEEDKEKVETFAEYHQITIINNFTNAKSDFQKASERNKDRECEVIVTHIPIDTIEANIKTAMSVYGQITGIKTTIVSYWKIANIIYNTPDEAKKAGDNWSTFILRDEVKIYYGNQFKEE